MSLHQLGTPTDTGAPAVTGQVVRSDTTGVWVAAVGADTRHPVGPCRGATRPTSGPDGLVWEQLPAGTTVLLILTTDGPWVAAHDHPTG